MYKLKVQFTLQIFFNKVGNSINKTVTEYLFLTDEKSQIPEVHISNVYFRIR